MITDKLPALPFWETRGIRPPQCVRANRSQILGYAAEAHPGVCHSERRRTQGHDLEEIRALRPRYRERKRTGSLGDPSFSKWFETMKANRGRLARF